MNDLNFWVVVRDGRRKWIVKYDPRQTITDGKRFMFEAHASEYKKKKEAEDKEAEAQMRRRQESLLGEAQGE